MRLRRAGLLSWVVGAGISVVVAGLALRIALSEQTKTAPTPVGVASAKTLRLSFPRAETSFDPAGVSDIYSGAVTAHIFESLYQYDYLARPYAVQPCTAAGMPEVSEDRRTHSVRIKPGIYFVDDPAFGGKRRELVAEDYVFSIKRLVDPKLRSPSVDDVLALGLIGLGELRKQALSGEAFDYDTPIVGLRALDRYTLQFQMTHPHAQLMFLLATKDIFGAVAREAVQHYGEDLGSHPVGTGPFVLAQWVRGSSVVLERNPSYRVTTYSASEGAQPLPVAEQAIADQLTGRSLPLIDRVEISIIEEHQPRWLSFLNRSQDILDDVPVQYASLAFAGSHVAPWVADRGILGAASMAPDLQGLLVNMRDPVLGGLQPERVALRRAVNLAHLVGQDIERSYSGRAMVAQTFIPPLTSSFDANLRTEAGEHEQVKAKALLDMFGYLDRNKDGWRENPDGSPLVLRLTTQSDQTSRSRDDQLAVSLAKVGLRLELVVGEWSENIKAVYAGNFQLWRQGYAASSPDSLNVLSVLYGRGESNVSGFKLPEFDALYDRAADLDDGPERNRLIRRAALYAVAYAPFLAGIHRERLDLHHPWVIGYRRPVFAMDWWQYVDIRR